MKILLLCNSFKGTLSSQEANSAIEEGIRALLPDAEIRSFELADGGQGASSIIAKLEGAEKIELEVLGPDCQKTLASYYRTSSQGFVEIAEASGLVKSDLSKSLLTKTSYGTGQLIRDAVENECESISVFFGGSGTNDAGVGMAKALGVTFFDKQQQLLPSPQLDDVDYPGEQPWNIADYDTSGSLIKKSFTLLGVVDVQNLLTGPDGASFVFGPQKGGTPDEIEKLDKGLQHLEQICYHKTQTDSLPGFGAAGGAAFGLSLFLGGKIISGPSYFLDLIRIDELLDWADIVITGEGRFDKQSLEGKLSAELYKCCRATHHVLYVLAGKVELGEGEEDIDGLFACDTAIISADGTPYAKLRSLARHFTSQVLIDE